MMQLRPAETLARAMLEGACQSTAQHGFLQ